MDLARLAIDIMNALGGPGIALVLAAEAVFPPVPGEVLLPFAGVSAADNGDPMIVPILWTTLGSVLGGLVVYGVGRALGLERTRALVARLPLLEGHDVDVAVRFFDRFGFPAVTIARFVPMVRTFISIPAGIERMPLWLFALATALGSGIWNAAFVIAGYLFGQAGGEALEAFVRIYSSIVGGLGLLAAIGFFTQRYRRRRPRSSERQNRREHPDRAEGANRAEGTDRAEGERPAERGDRAGHADRAELMESADRADARPDSPAPSGPPTLSE